MVEEGWKIKYEITTGLFSRQEHHILCLWTRPSPYLKIEVVGATGELVAAGVAFLTCRENFVEKFLAALGFLSLPTPPRDSSADFGAFSLSTVKMNLTLSWMGILEESPLLWLGIVVEICWICVSNILLKLISFEILPITTFLAVVEWETEFVSLNIEALIRTKSTVGITNEVDILGDRRAVDADVAYFSVLFTHYSGIDHFEMIKARVLKLLYKKINLGSEHVHLFKLVNIAGAGLGVLLIPALVRGHLLNQFTSFLNTESEEWTSSSSIYMLPGWVNQPMIEALDNESLLHAIMGACRDIIMQAFPCLSDGLIHELLKLRDLVPEGIGFAQ
jgi:hypothetical protein